MSETKLVEQVVSESLNEKVADVQVLTGGEVNRVYLVTTKGHKVVCRVDDKDTLHQFQKEQWCMQRVIAQGISTPKIYAVSSLESVAYMVIEFITGTSGNKIAPDARNGVWETLGRYASRFNPIHVKGFGDRLTVEGVFDDQWSRFLEYNIKSLTDNDILIQKGILTKAQVKLLRELFTGLKEKDFQVGLVHGDLSLHNVILTEDGKVYLLDWGCAEANFVPYAELIGVLENGAGDKGLEPTQEEFQAFRRGYGLTDDDFEKLWKQLTALWLLRRTDKLRWAIDRKPGQIPHCTVQLQAALKRIKL